VIPPLGNAKIKIFSFEIWNENFHFEIWKESAIPLERIEKNLKYFIGAIKKIWNEKENGKNHFLKFEMKILKLKNWNKKKYISFMPPRKNYQ
jgi:hypothetical protein